MNDLDQPSELVSETSPFDQAWSLTGSSLIAIAVVVFLLLTFGSPNLFGTDTGDLTDGRVVTHAYFGALILGAGMTAQALIGLWSLKGFSENTRLPWPRYRPLEGDEGIRPTPMATISLASIALIPAIGIYVGLYKYFRKSKISSWDAIEPLAPGFWSSRLAAASEPCPDSGACFRMHHQNGPEWFVLSDIVLLALIVAALIAWIVFAIAIRGRLKS